jgi:hypothetical protein
MTIPGQAHSRLFPSQNIFQNLLHEGEYACNQDLIGRWKGSRNQHRPKRSTCCCYKHSMNKAKPSKLSGHHETLQQCPENAREETVGRSDRLELKTFPQHFQIPLFDSSALKLEDNKETQRMQMKETVEKHIVMSLDYMDPAPSRKTTTRRKFSCEKKETKLAGQAA